MRQKCGIPYQTTYEHTMHECAKRALQINCNGTHLLHLEHGK